MGCDKLVFTMFDYPVFHCFLINTCWVKYTSVFNKLISNTKPIMLFFLFSCKEIFGSGCAVVCSAATVKCFLLHKAGGTR